MWKSSGNLNSLSIKLQAPKELPAQGVTRALFKPWQNHMINYLSQDLDNYRFMEGGDYPTWRPAKDFPPPNARIGALAEDDAVEDEDVRVHLGDSLEQFAARSEPSKAAAKEKVAKAKLRLRNAQLSKMIQIINVFIFHTEQPIIEADCTSLTWIFDFLEKHYNIQSKGANLLRIAECTYKSGTNYQTYYRELYAAIGDNLRRTGDNDLTGAKLTANEKISPTFNDYIILTALHNIDPRLPAKVKQDFEARLTQPGTYLSDIQTSVFQAIPSMLAFLNREADLSAMTAAHSINIQPRPQDAHLNAMSGPYQNRNQGRSFRGGRGSGGFGRGQRGGSSRGRPTDKYCKVCKVAGKPPVVYSSHWTSECGFFTNSDRKNLHAQLSAMSFEEEQDGSQETEWQVEGEEENDEETAQGSEQLSS